MNIDGLGKRDKILYAYNKLRNGASKLLMRTENSKQKGILCFGPLQIFSRGRKVTEKNKDGILAWLTQSSLVSLETDLWDMFVAGENAP